MDWILREVTETLGGGSHLGYATGGGLFLLYQGEIPLSNCVQGGLYADDFGTALIAEIYCST